ERQSLVGDGWRACFFDAQGDHVTAGLVDQHGIEVGVEVPHVAPTDVDPVRAAVAIRDAGVRAELRGPGHDDPGAPRPARDHYPLYVEVVAGEEPPEPLEPAGHGVARVPLTA